MTLKKTLLPCLMLISASTLITPLASAELPLVTDARIPATPPGAQVAAGYLTLTNSGDEALVLEGASSTTIEQVEMHLSEVVDDVARMTKQDTISVEAGESLAFEHGSYHLMLMGLSEPLEAGDVIDITLETNAGPVNLSMPVVDAGTAGDAGHDGAGMQHGDGEDTAMESEPMMEGEMDHGTMEEGEMDHGTMEDGEMKNDDK